MTSEDLNSQDAIDRSASKSYFEVEETKDNNHSLEPCYNVTTWRGDPEEIYSDWTVVVVTDDLTTQSYHVHKSILCFGPRQSKYFARAILNGDGRQNSAKKKTRHKEDGKNITKVELDARDAENFALALDFMYAPAKNMMSQESTVLTAASTLSTSLFSLPSEDESVTSDHQVFCTENAVSLRHLARKLEIESLLMAANRFIQRDLSFKTGPQYLLEAWKYRDERLLASAQRLCADNFDQLDTKALGKLPYQLFRVVVQSLESFETENKELSEFMSDVVCQYFEKNQKLFCAEKVLELTDGLLMPFISTEAAIGFTSLLKKLDSEDAIVNH